MKDIVNIMKLASVAYRGSKERIQELFELATDSIVQGAPSFTLSKSLAILLLKLFTDNQAQSLKVEFDPKTPDRPILRNSVIQDNRSLTKAETPFDAVGGQTENQALLKDQALKYVEKHMNKIEQQTMEPMVLTLLLNLGIYQPDAEIEQEDLFSVCHASQP